MTTAAESRRESARGHGTTGGQFGFQDHTPPQEAQSAAWPGTNREHRDHDFVPASAADWPALYGTEGQGSGLGGKQFVAHYSGVGYDYWVCEYDPKTREVFGYAQIAGHGDGEYGYADLNELERTQIQVFNPGAKSVDHMSVTTAAIHRDVRFEDLPASERYAHQHLDKYRGHVLDQINGDDRDEMNGVIKLWRTAKRDLEETQGKAWQMRAVSGIEAHAARTRVVELAEEHCLVFDPDGEGSFTVKPETPTH